MKKYHMGKTVAFLYLTAVIMFTCMGCSHFPDSEFIDLVEKGFTADKDGTRVITGLTSYRKTCIYGKPNSTLKSRIDKTYQFLDEEFDGFSEHVFTQNLEDCPADTLIYIYLYTHPFKRDELKKHLEIVTILYHEFLAVIKRNKIITSENIKEIARNVNPLAAIVTYGDGRRASTAFIAINQGDFNELLTEEDKHKYISVYNTVLTEELFQAISYGLDLNLAKKDPVFSKLHEKHNIEPNGTELSTFSEYLDTRATGFCEYDLWHLIISNKITGITNEINSPEQWTMSRYKTEFIKNYDEIKNQSSKIINNPKYTELFDPLCSGENRGVNSKIGL